MAAKDGRGRPSMYRPRLDAIGVGDGWVVISEDQKTLSAPSGMSARYPTHRFRCEKRADGKFNLLAERIEEEA